MELIGPTVKQVQWKIDWFNFIPTFQSHLIRNIQIFSVPFAAFFGSTANTPQPKFDVVLQVTRDLLRNLHKRNFHCALEICAFRPYY